MTKPELKSNFVFDQCKNYAEDNEYDWEEKGGVGYLHIHGSFLSTRVVRISFDEDNVLVGVVVSTSTPHGFIRTVGVLHAATDGRITLSDNDVLFWCTEIEENTFRSQATMDDLFCTMHREVFAAESLVQLFHEQMREVPVPSIFGFGSESEFDIRH